MLAFCSAWLVLTSENPKGQSLIWSENLTIHRGATSFFVFPTMGCVVIILMGRAMAMLCFDRSALP